MFANLALGTGLIFLTVVVHMTAMILLGDFSNVLIERLDIQRRQARMVAMVLVVLGLFFAHTVEVWLWAFAFWTLDAIPQFEAALYFSAVTFSTLGYSDEHISDTWRLLASLEGIDGFLLIGWSTAFLVAASTRIGPFRSGRHF
ncbi:MAG: two pore domain potassium channel family protein [Brucellaceae bacterium]|nr:two pore domain potassium channel family protein [Brucellaceae bacterium]